MSGILIAEPRAVCYDPSRDNCAAKTFILKDMSPEQEGAFRAFMGADIRNFEESTDGAVLDQIVTRRCKLLPNGNNFTGDRIACCPDSYRDDYKDLMFDRNGDSVVEDPGEISGKIRTMNLGKYDSGKQTYRLCSEEARKKCEVLPVEIEKMGFASKADCIKKYCNEAGYTRSLDKKELCLVDNDTSANSSKDCPLRCEYREIIQEDANYKAMIAAIVLGVILLIAIGVIVFLVIKGV